MAKTENLNNEQNIEGIISAPLVALSKANMMMLSGQTAFLLNNCFKLKGEGSFETKVGWGILSVSIKGSASYSSRDSSTHDTHYEKKNPKKKAGRQVFLVTAGPDRYNKDCCFTGRKKGGQAAPLRR